jgi:predicted nucleic acid-binding protein
LNEVVLDASVVMRWAFQDEQDREGALRISEAMASGGLMAVGPPNFLLEVAAALVIGIRTRRIDRQVADAILVELARIGVDEVDPHGFASASYRVALIEGIRVPDAAYVETARRSGAALVSADLGQLRAASAQGVLTIPLGEVPAGDR